jgi:hypothetical protein
MGSASKTPHMQGGFPSLFDAVPTQCVKVRSGGCHCDFCPPRCRRTRRGSQAPRNEPMPQSATGPPKGASPQARSCTLSLQNRLARRLLSHCRGPRAARWERAGASFPASSCLPSTVAGVAQPGTDRDNKHPVAGHENARQGEPWRASKSWPPFGRYQRQCMPEIASIVAVIDCARLTA